MPHEADIMHVESQIDECLTIMEAGIPAAFMDPGFRDCVNFRRADIVEQCRKLLVLLTDDDEHGAYV